MRGEIVPPCKLTVKTTIPPRWGFLLGGGVLSKGGYHNISLYIYIYIYHVCVCVCVCVCMYIYIYIYMYVCRERDKKMYT